MRLGSATRKAPEPVPTLVATDTSASQPAPQTNDRIAFARARIVRVLDRRRVAYYRELERQVCEVGYPYATTPARSRPEPLHFDRALKQLLAAGDVREYDAQVLGRNARLYARTAERDAEVRAAFTSKVAALTAYMRVEQMPPLAGHHAEALHHSALTSSEGWFSVGWKGGDHITRLHSRSLSTGDVDLAGVHLPSGTQFVAEIKNGREWIYPADAVIWRLFGAALELDAVPVLIARRMPRATFTLMKVLGGHAHRSVKMAFPPDARDRKEGAEPTFLEALTTLGFHTDADFVVAEAPPPRFVALWRQHLPPRLEEIRERFVRWSDEISDLAFGEDLRNDRRAGKSSGQSRQGLVQQLINDALAAYREEDEEDEVDDVEIEPDDYFS